eukprot:5303146-Karenia_brevis.AAC.1
MPYPMTEPLLPASASARGVIRPASREPAQEPRRQVPRSQISQQWKGEFPFPPLPPMSQTLPMPPAPAMPGPSSPPETFDAALRHSVT